MWLRGAGLIQCLIQGSIIGLAKKLNIIIGIKHTIRLTLHKNGLLLTTMKKLNKLRGNGTHRHTGTL